VPQRLHVMTSPNSDHFQQVGQQTFITTAHSPQWGDLDPVPCVDGADTVTGSAQTEISRCAARVVTPWSLARRDGGGRGIRALGGLAASAVFKSVHGAFGHARVMPFRIGPWASVVEVSSAQSRA